MLREPDRAVLSGSKPEEAAQRWRSRPDGWSKNQFGTRGIFRTGRLTYPDLAEDIGHDDLGNRSSDELDCHFFPVLLVFEQVCVARATSAQELYNIVCLFEAKVWVGLGLLALDRRCWFLAAGLVFVAGVVRSSWRILGRG